MKAEYETEHPKICLATGYCRGNIHGWYFQCWNPTFSFSLSIHRLFHNNAISVCPTDIENLTIIGLYVKAEMFIIIHGKVRG